MFCPKLQNQFANFVKHVEQSKTKNKKQLGEVDYTKKSINAKILWLKVHKM